MMRLLPMFLLLLIASPLAAQEPDAPETSEEGAEEEVVGIPVDYNDYLKKTYPFTDPGGEHDIFNLKNPKGKEARHTYTVAMAQLVLAYLARELGFAATLSKLFDQYSRGKEANSPVFKVLHALVLLYYPPGAPAVSEAQKLLREAAEIAPDYAYPHYMLARLEFERVMQIGDISPRDMLQSVGKALEIRPQFVAATALKCRLFLNYRPPREREVRELITPWVTDKLPAEDHDFEEVLAIYASCTTNTEFQARFAALLEREGLTRTQRVTLYRFAGARHFTAERYDDAIGHFEELLKIAKPDRDPETVLIANKHLAAAWEMKARALAKQLGDIEIKRRYDDFIEKSRTLNELCATLEKRHFPMAMRGGQALQYAQWLAYGHDRRSEAVEWLSAYLAETDLKTSWRNALENLRATLNASIDRTEGSLIELYRGYAQQDDMARLAISLGTAREAVRVKNEHFKEQASLRFFIEALDYGDRRVVGYAAFLVADTAKLIGGEAITQAGDALLARLLKETELKSEAQAKLHTDLAAALKTLGSWPHMEQAVRHSSEQVDDAKGEQDVRALTQPIIANWNDEALLKKLNPPMKRADPFDIYRPADAAKWMIKLADAIKKTAEADEE